MNKSFNYAANKVKFLLLPIAIIVLGVIMYFVHGGFNFDVEFMGGIRMQMSLEEDFENKDIADIIKDATGLDATVQRSATDGSLVIKLPATDAEDGGESNKNEVLKALGEKYTVDEESVNVQSASPSFGKEIQTKALTYTLFAILCILAYIIIRFEW